MKSNLFSISVLSIFFSPVISFAGHHENPEQQPCRDLIAGWYSGDASKMGNFMHKSFIKKGVLVSSSTGKTVNISHNKEEFIAAVVSERELSPEEEWDISVKTVHMKGDIATVEVVSRDLIDVCQLGKIDGEWIIMNVIWTSRQD